MTEDQKREVGTLYRRLAQRWGWPLPATWLKDRETIVKNIDDALEFLRSAVADQCPPEHDRLELARAHHAHAEAA